MRIRKLLMYIFILCSMLFIYLLYLISSYKDVLPKDKADVIIILGHAMEENNMPSSWLIDRLTYGLELYNLGYSNKILVTGGQGKANTKPVSISMQKWLIENGISINDIIVEQNAKNTFENFIYSKKILEEHELDSIIIVTNDFHMYRSTLIANNIYENVYSYSSSIPFSINKILAYLKEPLSIIKYFILHKNYG